MAYYDHLRALAQQLKKMNEVEKAKLLKHLNLSDPEKRNVVLKAIDAEMPGMSKHLDEVWLDARARAVHFFHVPILDGTTFPALKRVVADKYGKEAASGEWVFPRRPRTKHAPHMSALRLSTTELDLRVHLYFEKFARVDGETNPYTTDLDVDIQVDLARKGGRVAAVFATTNAAKLGLRLGLEDLLDVEIPQTRSRKQEKYMIPMRLTEALAKKLAAELGLKVTEMNGIDPHNRLGGYSVYGKDSGSKRLPLDIDDPRVKEREKAGNGIRDYSYDFPHKDGFKEWTEARFTFSGFHPHVTFTTVSSRPAKRYLLDAIRDRLIT